MFNLSQHLKYSEEIREELIKGLEDGVFFLYNCETKEVKDWIELVRIAKFLPPLERAQQPFVSLRSNPVQKYRSPSESTGEDGP